MNPPKVVAVALSNMDVALFVNDQLVCALEATEEGESPVEIGRSLANALGVPLAYEEAETPQNPEWTWSDVYENLAPVVSPA